MQTWQEEIDFDFSDPTIDTAFTENSIFFDIETTGFSAVRNTVYLIGCGTRRSGRLLVTQFFAEKPAEERAVLSAFFAYLAQFSVILSFNGIGFDIPFLRGRCEALGLADGFAKADFSYVDLYKKVTSMKRLLQLPDYKQKTVEQFLGVTREDRYDGGQLIAVYKSYVANPSEEARELLKLHNFEDVCGMPQLLSILSYEHFLQGDFSVTSLRANEYRAYDPTQTDVRKKELYFTVKNETPLPAELSSKQDGFQLHIGKTESQICVGLTEEELNYYLPNPEQYYYLPAKDTVILKELASDIPRGERQKATRSLCCTKKHALFLPQRTELFTPAFRRTPKDRESYFELSKEFAGDRAMQHTYLCHLLSGLHS